jgi:hypothetical protein
MCFAFAELFDRLHGDDTAVDFDTLFFESVRYLLSGNGTEDLAVLVGFDNYADTD